MKLSAALAVIWHIIVTFLTLIPGKDLPKVDIVNFDKFAHTGVFALLTYLYLRWQMAKSPVLTQKHYLLVLGLIAYGGLIELIQGAFYVDRHASWFDFLANSLGCIIILALVYWNKTILLLKNK